MAEVGNIIEFVLTAVRNFLTGKFERGMKCRRGNNENFQNYINNNNNNNDDDFILVSMYLA